MPNSDKFKKLVHYVCWRCADDPKKLGAVQLNKILWLSDLQAYYSLGMPITKARYVKRQFGPVPSSIVPILRELQQEHILTVRDVQFFGRPKKEFIVHRNASADFLQPDEQEIVDEMIRFVTEQHTAKSISDASHDHIWKAAQDGELLPHFTVFARPAKITTEDREWARSKLEGNGK
jgi:hypothetical protein